eukprot:GFKZ01012510.1.p1 GENE.GFKZ01012510.1~~GFKZ01012510.1.p1  ORF type:complete len:230 (-),score=42.59 GFKZ01012510.1:31-720(-)
MATLGTGAPKESTEWDDILKSKGIIPEKSQEELAKEALHELVEDVVEQYDPHENKDVETLEEDLEDADSDEEKILQQYREMRISQMRAESLKPKFGPGVAHVAANEWKAQVTDAGDEVYVVVHLFQPGLEGCKIMDARLLELSTKFRNTKFVRCKATDAIKNYPESKCPTLLVYKGGKVLKQMIGLGAYGVVTPVAADIEWALSKTGAVETDMTEPPRPEAKRFNLTRS